jgi:hypothetical protein
MTRTMEQFPYLAPLEYASMGRLSGVVAVLLLLGVSFGVDIVMSSCKRCICEHNRAMSGSR